MRFCEILFFALLVLFGSTQSCASTQDPSLLLQTGKIQVINSNSAQASRLHSYSIPITYLVPLSGFQIAASISGLSLTNQFKNYYDFTVRGGRGASASSAQVAVFITDDSTWTSLQVSYLISSRSDLFLGSFVADGYIFQSTNNNLLTLSFGIPNWVSTSVNIIGVTEFAGLRTFLSQPLNISFVNTNINGGTGLLKVVISTNTAFQLLYLTYYWWISGSPDLAFTNFNLNDGSILAYPFVGLEAINGTQIIYAGSGFNRLGLFACNGDKCPTPCVNTNTCGNLKGIQSNVACFLCGPNQVYSNNNCVNAFVCGANQRYNGSGCSCAVGYVLVSGACLPSCGTNAYVNSSGACQCISNPGCTQVSPCPANQILVEGKCICDQGYTLINGVCVNIFPCPSGTVWNSASQSCVCANPSQYLSNGVCQSCIANSAWNGTRCNCNAGFQLINGICSNCPPNSAWNGNFCACVTNYYLINGVCSQCQPNSAWNGTACNCLSGFNLINGTCVPCPTNSVWVASQQSCVCLSGFYMVNGVCISCPANSYWNGNVCVCLSGILVNNACVQCPANSAWNGNGCACVTNYYLINGVCSQCPPNTAWNGTACTCIANFYLINGVCSQCPANTAWNGNSCVCVANYYLINGVCSQCQPNSAWNGTACNCLLGFNSVNGSCISCPPSSIWVADQQVCACLSGFYLINGSCVTCPVNSGWNGSACICLGGFAFINGVCSRCPPNNILNGTSCICSPGFYNISGVCGKCQPNSAWNGVTCACSRGFSLRNGLCIRCPARSKWNGSACECNKKGEYIINNVCAQCPPNSAWDGSSCICINGYYPNGGFCLACGSNSFWNGITCVCQDNTVLLNGACVNIPNCEENSAWDGTACACIEGFYQINGACQTCPENTNYNGSECVTKCQPKAIWDGSSCVCQTGFYLIQNSCLPCDPNSIYDQNTQTCICKDGYFGTFQLCTLCDPSCRTCTSSGSKGCTSCPAGITFNAGSCIAGCASGQVLINGACVNCPSNCTVCSNATTCTQCAPNFSISRQIVNGVSVVGCQLAGPPSSTPASLMSLKGVVVGNNVIYQGLTLSTLPAYFLTTNCASCQDLFIVNISPDNLGVSYAVSFVLNSQYWFLIEFRYTSKVNPSFQFKVQLNFKYANYFTAADMAQSFTNSVTPIKYPTTPTPPTTTGPRINPGGPVKTITVANSTSSSAPSGVASTQSVSRGGSIVQIPSTTLKTIFG